MRTLQSILLGACLITLGGCWNGRVLIAVEQPWWEAHGGDALLRRPFTRLSLTHGYVPHFLPIGIQEDSRAKLTKELTAHRYQAAIISPLLSLEPQSYAPASASTRFLLVADPLAAAIPANAMRLVFDRTNAFRTAGFAAGLAVREEAGGVASAALALRIGVLTADHPPGTGDELNAFNAGVAQALDGGRPSVRTLRDPIDRNAVRAALDDMRRDGAEIFLLFLGVADSWALEAMKSSSGCGIVSDWAASGAFPDQVFLSIENDLPAGISLFLSHRGGGAVLEGPVHIVSGKARSIPPEIAAQVQHP